MRNEIRATRISGVTEALLNAAVITLSNTLKVKAENISLSFKNMTFAMRSYADDLFRLDLSLGPLTVEMTQSSAELSYRDVGTLHIEPGFTRLYSYRESELSFGNALKLSLGAVTATARSLKAQFDTVTINGTAVTVNGSTVSLSGQKVDISGNDTTVSALRSAEVKAATVAVNGGSGVTVHSSMGKTVVSGLGGAVLTSSPVPLPVIPGSAVVESATLAKVVAPQVSLGMFPVYHSTNAEPLVQVLTTIMTLLNTIVGALTALNPAIGATVAAPMAVASAMIPTIPNLTVRQ